MQMRIVLLTTTETALKSGTYKLHRWVELKDVATGVTDITPEQIAAQAQALAAHLGASVGAQIGGAARGRGRLARRELCWRR